MSDRRGNDEKVKMPSAASRPVNVPVKILIENGQPAVRDQTLHRLIQNRFNGINAIDQRPQNCANSSSENVRPSNFDYM